MKRYIIFNDILFNMNLITAIERDSNGFLLVYTNDGARSFGKISKDDYKKLLNIIISEPE